MQKWTCKKCSAEFTRWNTIQNICQKCMIEKNREKQLSFDGLKKTKPKAIGKKRIERIKKEGSEYKVFVEIWKERDHICENCGGQIKFFHASCFAHKENKRDNPKLRYEKTNIALVHGVFETMDDTGKTYNCHKEFDLKYKNIKKL